MKLRYFHVELRDEDIFHHDSKISTTGYYFEILIPRQWCCFETVGEVGPGIMLRPYGLAVFCPDVCFPFRCYILLQLKCFFHSTWYQQPMGWKLWNCESKEVFLPTCCSLTTGHSNVTVVLISETRGPSIKSVWISAPVMWVCLFSRFQIVFHPYSLKQA